MGKFAYTERLIPPEEFEYWYIGMTSWEFSSNMLHYAVWNNLTYKTSSDMNRDTVIYSERSMSVMKRYVSYFKYKLKKLTSKEND